MLVFGKRLYGKVLRCGESHVATWFFHLWLVPLIPLGSVIVLRTEGAATQVLKTRLHLPSLGLAYLRAWSVFFLLHGLLNWAEERPSNGEYYGPVVTLLAAVGVIVGFFVLGRTRADTRARLETYGRVFGHPVDLALLGPEADGVATWLRQQLVASGRKVAVNYRVTYDPETQWGAIALDPSMNDARFLTHALCLARIERSKVKGAERASLDTLHDRIWERLRSLDAARTPPDAPSVQPTP